MSSYSPGKHDNWCMNRLPRLSVKKILCVLSKAKSFLFHFFIYLQQWKKQAHLPLTRVQTIVPKLAQCSNSVAKFYWCEGQFREKIIGFHFLIDKFRFLVPARTMIMLQSLDVQFCSISCQAVVYRRLKTKETFKLFSSKSGRGRLRQGSH